MKIAWLTSRHPPDVGGMANSSGRIVNSLRDRGHAVAVIHLTQNPGQVVAVAQKQASGNPLHNHWQSVLTTGINAPLEPERVFWSCQKILADSVIIGFGGDWPGYLATLWATWLHRKSVVLFRGSDFERVIHDERRAWLTHFVLTQADLVGAVSQEMTARIKTLRSRPTVYTPNGIDSTEWRFFASDVSQAQAWRAQNIPAGKAVIGLVGQLKAKKGLDLALTLLASAGFRKKVHLLTVGDLPENFVPPQQTDSQASWTHVPFQTQARLPIFYAVADVVLLPSVYDGLPNVLLEALALEKIVVASRAGGIPDVITDGGNGFLFALDDVASSIKALDTALSLNQEERARLGANARKTVVEHFTPAHEVERIEAELLSHVTQPPHPLPPLQRERGNEGVRCVT